MFTIANRKQKVRVMFDLAPRRSGSLPDTKEGYARSWLDMSGEQRNIALMMEIVGTGITQYGLEKVQEGARLDTLGADFVLPKSPSELTKGQLQALERVINLLRQTDNSETSGSRQESNNRIMALLDLRPGYIG